MKRKKKGIYQTRKLSWKRIAILVIAFAALAAAVVILVVTFSPEAKKVLTGLGKISTARLHDEDTQYSYYDENGTALLTPYEDNGLGTGTMAEVIVPYAECTDGSEVSNLSNPLCSSLTRGTVDRVASVLGDADNPIYVLESGVKVNDEYLKITENAYLLPENTLTVSTCEESNNGVKFTLDTLWAVPVQMITEPQEYYTGYLDRIYNVAEYTAEYMDIRFAHTASLEGTLDFSASDVIRSYEWLETESGGTLRLYFKQTGTFYGSSYSLDGNGRFSFVIKQNITQDDAPVVMLDPGHGGSDPGAASLTDTYESEVTLNIAEKVAENLAERGVRVVMTRRDEVDVSIDERLAMNRKYAPALFVSIHCDSSDNTALFGTHTFYYKNFSQPLAQSIHENMAAVYQGLYAADEAKAAESDRGIKFYPFAVTRVEDCPSVLVECGYLSNEEDCDFLMSEAGRLQIAAAIADGIAQQLNIA